MIEARKVANVIESEKEKAYAYEGTVKPYLDDIRYPHRQVGIDRGQRIVAIAKIQRIIICTIVFHSLNNIDQGFRFVPEAFF